MSINERIEKALAEVRPTLQRDGGDVEFVELSGDKVVRVRLTGACHSCPMSRITLKEGIEKFLKSEIPELTAVEAVD